MHDDCSNANANANANANVNVDADADVDVDESADEMKTAVLAGLGGVLLIAGIALLVLPGPGFVLIAAGLALLATRFDWAKKPLDYAKDKAQQGIDEVGRKPWRAVLALICALGLIAIGVVDLSGVDLPLVNVVSAVLLIVSGLFLIGTIVYAQRTATAENVATAKS